MRFEGSLKTWNDERGFGFVLPDQGGDEIFVHIKAIANLKGRPAPDQRMSFEVEVGPAGKKRAKNVLPIRAVKSIQRGRSRPVQRGIATLFAIPGFLVIYLVVAVLWRPPSYVALGYLDMSILTFAAYASDKSAAARGAWRTPESTLHALALGCGWPGALVAQQILKHKSTKAEFRAIFWNTALLNVAIFFVISSPIGNHLLPR